MAQAGEIFPSVVVDPEIVHGKPVIAGTRIPVALVLGQLAGGVSFEELEREYGLSREQVQAALGYAAELVPPRQSTPSLASSGVSGVSGVRVFLRRLPGASS